MAVTIKDIARELGISPSTVSRALKDHPDISVETKKAVKELARKLNYQPDLVALSLKKGQSRTIGVIVPEIVHYFFSTVISGIEAVAYESGYRVMICQSNEKYEREVENIDALLYSRVDGILVSLSKKTRRLDHLKKVLDRHVPMVMFDRIAEELDTDKVYVDDQEAAYNAVKHLIRNGYKNIVHFAAPQNLGIGKLRKEGYVKALEEFQLPVREEYIIKCDTMEEAVEKTEETMRLVPRPDAFFCVNDMTAAGVMKVLKKLQYQIPDDVAIVGFTNGEISNLPTPAITSVEQHGFEIGKEAAHLLIERLSQPEKEIPPRRKVIKTNLVVKGSTVKILT
jgi:LacI family transcriptional regulator